MTDEQLRAADAAVEGGRIVSDLYTVEECKALLDSHEGRCELEPAIGRACGLWNTRHYLTALPSDYEYGAQCFEMWQALPRGKGECWTYEDCIDYHRVWRHSQGADATIMAPTLADALCLALAEAGLLKRGASDEDDA